MKNIFRDIEDNFQSRELVLSFLLTGVFLFLSFAGHTRFSTTEIIDQSGEAHPVHISYYGFPFEMIGFLNPMGRLEAYWAYYNGGGLLRILWGGLILNFALYFLLAFAIVYLSKKVEKLISRNLGIALEMFLPVEDCTFDDSFDAKVTLMRRHFLLIELLMGAECKLA